MTAFDTLILGGGVAGLATAWHLAARGATRILLLERERTLGARASSENAAILRTLSADPVTDRIARRGARFLRAPAPGFAAYALVDRRGLLLCASGERATRLAEAGEAAGADRPTRLAAGERRSRAPHFAPPPDAEPESNLWFEAEGRLDVAAELEGFARGARAGGVELRTGCAVTELLLAEGGRGVRGVRCAGGTTIEARTTVLAAGGWAGALGAAAGSRVALRPTRRHLLVTAAEERVDPRWPVVWVEDEGFYCRPESGGLLLSACDLEDADPDAYAPDPRALEWVAAKAERFLPGLADAGVAHLWCGLRTLTADDRFAVGFDPDVEGLYWVAGLGGHGMTCGPEVGRLASLGLDPRVARSAEDERLLAALDPARLVPQSVGV